MEGQHLTRDIYFTVVSFDVDKVGYNNISAVIVIQMQQNCVKIGNSNVVIVGFVFSRKVVFIRTMSGFKSSIYCILANLIMSK